MSVNTEAATDKADLAALDAALSPLRRVLQYAKRGKVQYLGAIGSTWLQRAIAAQPPEAVVDLLAEMGDALGDYDTSGDQDDRRDRVDAALARVDSLLGLPRPVRLARRRRPRRGGNESAKRDGASRDGERAGGKGRKRGRGRGRSRGRDEGERSSAGSSSSAKSTEVDARLDPDASASKDSVGRRLSDDALSAPISTLEGGESAEAALAKVGVISVASLLMYAPSGEQVVQPLLGAGRLTEAGRVAVGGRVKRRKTIAHADGTVQTTVLLHGAGPTLARWQSGAPGWVMDRLEPGSRVVLVGEAVANEAGEFELLDPELGMDDGKHAVRLATYGVEGVDDRVLRALVAQSLPEIDGLIDPLPVSAPGGVRLAAALTQAHTRGSRSPAAKERLAYDEALLIQLAALWVRFQGPGERGLSHNLLHGLSSRVLQMLETELSDEQQLAFEEVKRDLRAPTPMRRVLTGEVGAGKGLVALLSTALVADNKHQVLVVAPDQATAEQRFGFTEPLLRELGLVARLYLDAPSRAQLDAIRRGEVHVLFGTADLLGADIEYRRLGLVIAGERGVFGGIPPMVAALKSPSPDVLIVTSTPVSQPVLMAAYPTYDHTVLRNFPGQAVPAEVLTAEARSRAYASAAEAVEAGHQVVVVFPMSRGADVLDVREALRVVSTLEQSVFPGSRVKLFHGGMSREERYRTYTDFRDRRLDVLVATTHFEAGPTVPGASVVIIEQADRMSLSRLHRVRGHISVGMYAPKCWLITGEHPDELGLERVGRFARSADGFSVSLQELDIRGLKDMLVGEPPPAPVVHWLDPRADLDILVRARADARALLQRDPGLRQGKHIELARYLRARWEPLVGTECPVAVSPGATGRRRRRRRKR